MPNRRGAVRGQCQSACLRRRPHPCTVAGAANPVQRVSPLSGSTCGAAGGGEGGGGLRPVGRRLHSKRKWEHENSRYAEVKPVGCNAHMYSVWNPEGRHLIWEVRKRALSETRPTEPPRLLVPLIAAHRRRGCSSVCAASAPYIHTYPPRLAMLQRGVPSCFSHVRVAPTPIAPLIRGPTARRNVLPCAVLYGWSPGGACSAPPPALIRQGT